MAGYKDAFLQDHPVQPGNYTKLLKSAMASDEYSALNLDGLEHLFPISLEKRGILYSGEGRTLANKMYNSNQLFTFFTHMSRVADDRVTHLQEVPTASATPLHEANRMLS